MTSELKKTPLYQNYVDSGAKIVEFGGWAMPVQFSSIKEEHNAVRYEIGLFDVSHMGEIEIQGNDAKSFVQYILSNDTNNLTDSKALYTALCCLLYTSPSPRDYILHYVMKKVALLTTWLHIN